MDMDQNDRNRIYAKTKREKHRACVISGMQFVVLWYE